MRKKITNLCWIILFVFVFVSWTDEDYTKYIGKDWHPRVVEGSEISLLRGGANYHCYLKAIGWKILSKRREKMGMFGDLYIKWGWKVVAYNPGTAAIQFSIKVELKSDEGFVLDTDIFGKGFLNDYRSVEWIYPGEIQVFQHVSEFNASEAKGEGEPSYLDYSVICK